MCAGDLCGRLAGGWLSILQTFEQNQVDSKHANAASNLAWTTTALKTLDFGPKILSEEFDPGSE